jgi:hypothetical protein
MSIRGAARRSALLLLAAAGAALAAPAAQARQNGLPSYGCTSCHSGGRAPVIAISLDPPAPAPGADATVTVQLSSVAGQGGFYLHAFAKGTFRELPGQGTRLATPLDVVHAAPRPAAAGVVTFQVGWTAPASTGTVDFEVFAVAANGDRTLGGDGTTSARLSVTVGCEGIELFQDNDGDGYGSDQLPKRRVCQSQAGFAARGGDCDDYVAYIRPGAPERCDGLDNDCDGQKDEGLEGVSVYRDADGDGHGDAFGTDTRTGCAGGYAPTRDDCDDGDRAVNPGVKETCNAKDDNCDGRADEGARATCGTGWCRAAAGSCEARDCIPGTPRAELCNLFDDDCDGVVDNGARCEGGRVCFGGRCLTGEDATAAAEADRVADGGAPTPPGPPPVMDAGAGPPPGGGAGGTGGTAGPGGAGGSAPNGAPPAGGGRAGGACSYARAGASAAPALLTLTLPALAWRGRRRRAATLRERTAAPGSPG